MIVTVGDSFTVKRFEGDKPWPEHLAQAMDLPLLNLSHEGESNSFMHRNLTWACEKYGGMISHVVISLTNWDRHELPYKRYEGMGSKTKTFKPKAIKHHKQDTDPFALAYLKYYNLRYYIDQTAMFLIHAQQLQAKHGFDMIIMQPIVPFHWGSWNKESQNVLETGASYELQSQQWQTSKNVHYIDNESLLQYVDRSFVMGYDMTGENIIFETNSKNDMWYNFTRKNSHNCMGFHDKMGDEFMSLWDGHPNQRGHKLIARKVLERFDEISDGNL